MGRLVLVANRTMFQRKSTTSPRPARKLSSVIVRLLYCLVIAWTFWPIAILLLTNGVAGALGCKLSEGGPSPCHLLGLDISRAMYVGAVSFWYALTTLPTGIPLLILLGVVHLCVQAVSHSRRRAISTSEGNAVDR
jgi:hypothetical protein